METKIEEAPREMTVNQEALMWKVLGSSWILKHERDEVCYFIKTNDLTTKQSSAIIALALGLIRYRGTFYDGSRKSRAKCNYCDNKFFLRFFYSPLSKKYVRICEDCVEARNNDAANFPHDEKDE